VLVAAALLASPLSSAAQQTRTQQVQLEQGWNFVSLSVQPDDSSFAAIFGANVDQISIVKNEAGEVYAPEEGIEQITSWKSREGYQVHAETAVTLEVTGMPIRPDSLSVVLEEGGNIVPYLSSAAQEAETAVASLEGSLVLVEDEAGVRYEPSASSSSLDSLRPGQAYKVYVDRTDTLRYPVVVLTLADARELKDVKVGTTIQVQGYDTPDDEGGGLFRATKSACETNGGTCFIFNEDLSVEQSYALSGSPTWTLPNGNIDWGSFEMKYGPDQNDVIGALGLHGHTRKSKNLDWLDLKSGEILDGGNELAKLNQTFGAGNKEYTVNYRYATSDRRLERVVNDAVNIAWWGAPKADPNNPQRAGRELAWAINAASKLYNQGNYPWAYVDIPDNYYYKHLFKIRDGVKLRGVGPDRSVPGESWTTNGALTLMPGEAMYTWHVDFDPVAEHDERAVMEGGKNGLTQFFTNSYLASKIGIQDLEINGNLDNNQQVFNNQGQYDNLLNRLQNASDWTALYMPGAGTLEYEDEMDVELHQLNSVGFGGNNVGGAGAELDPDRGGATYKVRSENVRLEDAVRNHQIYQMPGPKKKNWTVVQVGWAAPVKMGSKDHRISNYTDLTVVPTENPWFNDVGVFNSIGKNITVDGFEVDLTGNVGFRKQIWNDSWGKNTYKNGTVKTKTGSGSISLNTSNTFNLPIDFQNITVEDFGAAPTFGNMFGTEGYNYFYENVTVTPQDGVGPIPRLQDVSVVFGFGMRSPITTVDEPTLNNWERAMRVGFRNFEYNREIQTRVFRFNDDQVSAPYHPFDVFFVDSKIENSNGDGKDSSKFLSGKGGNGQGAFRLYWDNMTFNTPLDRSESLHKWLGSDSVLRIRNSQDRSGRVSDAVNQSYTATSDDENNGYALIPTNLLSRPGETTVTANAGYSVTGVEVANSDGSLRSDDNLREEDPYLKVSVDGSITQGDTFTWTARVTPLEDYSTTGLFIARKEENKSYVSGNGPWTIDLRGVAASQESREKIVYTASSGDTSVVTANVQSDEYTLEFTEQGTGTATITVTGSIDGVGTTTDTFQVTIE
jgi:hypothetical protein